VLLRKCDIVFNPSTAYNDYGPLNRWQAFVDACDRDGEVDWTGKKTARFGDLYLFWFSAPKHCIAGVGFPNGEVFGKTRWPSPQIGFAVKRLPRPIGIDEIRDDSTLTRWWAGNPYWGGPKTIKQAAVAKRLLDLILEKNPGLADLLTRYLDVARFEPRPLTPKHARSWSSRLSRLSAEEQERIFRMIVRAERDRGLRPRVLALWGNACAACGATLSTREGGPWECEVAHIREVRAKGGDELDNAFPVCRTHHWAFDQRLWAIVPKTLRIAVAQSHRASSSLARLHGKHLVSNGRRGPATLDKDILRERFESLLD
jgi:hypothetical protein